MTMFIRGAITPALCALLAALASPACAAEPLEINVPVGSGGSSTVPSAAYAAKEVKKIPGAAAIVPAKEFNEGYALSMKDMLKSTPGVMAQPRWGEESRLSIRGSGLSRGFHMRGITLFQDGIPLTAADGSSDFQEIDPLILQHVEVYRGGNGLRYGTSSLGGAVNMVTPSARTLNYNGLLRAEGGSFGTLRLHGQAARTFGNADAFAAATQALSDGYRDQSEQDNLRFSGNTGIRINDRAETRFYLAWNDLKQEVPGTISKSAALHNPKSAPPVNISGNYSRDIRSLRAANRTVITFDKGANLEFGAYANDKSLYHPIFEVIDQDSLETGGFARYNGKYDFLGYGNEFTAGLNIRNGINDAKRFVNIRGKRGALRYDARQEAGNYELYGENRLNFAPQWHLVTGLQATLSTRDYTDHRNAANNTEEDYRSLNPKLGLLWTPARDTEIYANITRSSEAPTYSELVQGAVPGFVPVKLQTAWTAELGTRGQQGQFSWDATIYNAVVSKELLNYTVAPDVPASTFNADKTVHRGLELGAGWRIDDNISLRGIYNFNDFSFDGDAQFGDNDLAGAPRHQIRLSARYERNGFFIEPNVEWVPQSPWVDYANTLKADSYAMASVNAGVEINDNVSFFVDARNLTDEKTITSFSTVTDARAAATNVFYPADGRSVFGGIKIKF